MKHSKLQNDYKLSAVFKTSQERLFLAISTELSVWWGSQNKAITKKGDVFRVSWGEPWYEFIVIDYYPHELMVWECIDSNQIINGLEGVRTEWVGTKIFWQIEKLSSSECQLNFVHKGLNPAFNCYSFCTSKWSEYINSGLNNYLDNNMDKY